MVDCRGYIEDFLSAHVDNELSEQEREAAAEHLRHCLGNCADRFAAEQLLKNWLRQRVTVTTPPDLRSQLLTALDRSSQRSGAAAAAIGVLGRWWLWIPIALALAAVIAALLGRRLG